MSKDIASKSYIEPMKYFPPLWIALQMIDGWMFYAVPAAKFIFLAQIGLQKNIMKCLK